MPRGSETKGPSSSLGRSCRASATSSQADAPQEALAPPPPWAGSPKQRGCPLLLPGAAAFAFYQALSLCRKYPAGVSRASGEGARSPLTQPKACAAGAPRSARRKARALTGAPSRRNGGAASRALSQNGTSSAPSAAVTNRATTCFSPARSKATASLSPSTAITVPDPNFW